MDDPTLRRENDAGNETRLSGPPIPSGGPILYSVVSPQLSVISSEISIQTVIAAMVVLDGENARIAIFGIVQKILHAAIRSSLALRL